VKAIDSTFNCINNSEATQAAANRSSTQALGI
jgi:hypothetical protein